MAVKIVKIDCPLPNTEEYMFWCEGCGQHHSILVREQHPCWTFNGNFEKPTINPSVRHTFSFVNQMCHYVITDGMMHFEDDSTHELKGQTVEMKDIE